MPYSGLKQSQIDASIALIRDFHNATSVAPLIALLRPE
jgi:hypothetical protein